MSGMPGTIQYRGEAPFTGDPGRAIDLARATLMGQDFQIISASDTQLVAKSPSLNSTKQSMLRGAGFLRLWIEDGKTHAEATLDGVKMLQRMVFVLPLAIDALVILILMLTLEEKHMIPAIGAGVVAPWLLIAPWFARLMKSRTREALDVFLANLSDLPPQAR